MNNSNISILSRGGKCEVCDTLVGVKIVKVGAHTVSLCEACRDSLANVIAIDLLESMFTKEGPDRPACNFCGRRGYAGEGTHSVHGYTVLNSCHRCELEILSDDGEE